MDLELMDWLLRIYAATMNRVEFSGTGTAAGCGALLVCPEATKGEAVGGP